MDLATMNNLPQFHVNLFNAPYTKKYSSPASQNSLEKLINYGQLILKSISREMQRITFSKLKLTSCLKNSQLPFEKKNNQKLFQDEGTVPTAFFNVQFSSHVFLECFFCFAMPWSQSLYWYQPPLLRTVGIFRRFWLTTTTTAVSSRTTQSNFLFGPAFNMKATWESMILFTLLQRGKQAGWAQNAFVVHWLLHSLDVVFCFSYPLYVFELAESTKLDFRTWFFRVFECPLHSCPFQINNFTWNWTFTKCVLMLRRVAREIEVWRQNIEWIVHVKLTGHEKWFLCCC